MAKKTETTKTPTNGKPEISKEALIAALEVLFDSDWEFPDDVIVGPFKNKVAQLEARVNNLTAVVGKLAERAEGPVPERGGRINAVEAAKAPTAEKKAKK